MCIDSWVTEARLGADGVMRFLGEGTLTQARGDVTTFAVSGSAQAGPPPVDTMIWDILGSNAHHITTDGKLVLTAAEGAPPQ